MADTAEDARQLEISLRAEGPDLLLLSVRDHGSGISPENLSKLFNPFFTTKREGMGIGLAICRTIVEACGGSLLGRNGEDGGAVFDVRLPTAQAHDAEGLAAE